MTSEIIGFLLILILIFSVALQYLMLDTERKQLNEARERKRLLISEAKEAMETKKLLTENLKPKYIKDDQRKPNRSQRNNSYPKHRV